MIATVLIGFLQYKTDGGLDSIISFFIFRAESKMMTNKDNKALLSETIPSALSSAYYAGTLSKEQVVEVFMIASMNNNVAALKYLASTLMGMNEGQVHTAACKAAKTGSLEVLQWLRKRFQFQPKRQHKNLLWYAAVNNHAHVVAWLQDEFQYGSHDVNSDLLRETIQRRCGNVLNVFYKRYHVDKKNILDGMRPKYRADLINQTFDDDLTENDVLMWIYEMIKSAIEDNDLDYFQQLVKTMKHNLTYVINPRNQSKLLGVAIIKGVENNTREFVFELCMQKFTILDDDEGMKNAMYAISEKGAEGFLLHLKDFRLLQKFPAPLMKESFEVAFNSGQVGVMTFLQQHFPITEYSVQEEYLHKVTTRVGDRSAMLQWIQEHFEIAGPDAVVKYLKMVGEQNKLQDVSDPFALLQGFKMYFGYTADMARSMDNWLLRKAAKSGAVEFMVGMKKCFGLTTHDIRAKNNNIVRKTRQVCVLKCLVEGFGIGTEDVCCANFALLHNANAAMMSYLREFFPVVVKYYASQKTMAPINKDNCIVIDDEPSVTQQNERKEATSKETHPEVAVSLKNTNVDTGADQQKPTCVPGVLKPFGNSEAKGRASTEAATDKGTPEGSSPEVVMKETFDSLLDKEYDELPIMTSAQIAEFLNSNDGDTDEKKRQSYVKTVMLRHYGYNVRSRLLMETCVRNEKTLEKWYDFAIGNGKVFGVSLVRALLQVIFKTKELNSGWHKSRILFTNTTAMRVQKLLGSVWHISRLQHHVNYIIFDLEDLNLGGSNEGQTEKTNPFMQFPRLSKKDMPMTRKEYEETPMSGKRAYYLYILGYVNSVLKDFGQFSLKHPANTNSAEYFLFHIPRDVEGRLSYNWYEMALMRAHSVKLKLWRDPSFGTTDIDVNGYKKNLVEAVPHLPPERNAEFFWKNYGYNFEKMEEDHPDIFSKDAFQDRQYQVWNVVKGLYKEERRGFFFNVASVKDRMAVFDQNQSPDQNDNQKVAPRRTQRLLKRPNEMLLTESDLQTDEPNDAQPGKKSRVGDKCNTPSTKGIGGKDAQHNETIATLLTEIQKVVKQKKQNE